MLHAQIAHLIRDNPDPHKAAVLICSFLEDKIDLRDNGWFDDDPIMEEFFDNLDTEELESPE